MKLVIPPEFNLTALTYKIVTSDKLLEKLRSRATSNIKEQVVRLPKDEVKPAQQFVELLHEVEHLCNDILDIKDNESRIIQKSHLMAQFLMSLGIEPDFSQIPEEE